MAYPIGIASGHYTHPDDVEHWLPGIVECIVFGPFINNDPLPQDTLGETSLATFLNCNESVVRFHGSFAMCGIRIGLAPRTLDELTLMLTMLNDNHLPSGVISSIDIDLRRLDRRHVSGGFVSESRMGDFYAFTKILNELAYVPYPIAFHFHEDVNKDHSHLFLEMMNRCNFHTIVVNNANQVRTVTDLLHFLRFLDLTIIASGQRSNDAVRDCYDAGADLVFVVPPHTHRNKRAINELRRKHRK